MSMRMTTSIVQKQTQQLTMTPKLQQAIKILQMHRLELAQYVTQQMVENPVLEEIDSYEEIEETGEENSAEDEISNLENETAEADVDLDTGLLDTDASTEGDSPELDITDDDFGDMNWQEYFMDDAPVAKNEWEAPLDDDMRDNTGSLEESLEEHLLWQLRMSAIPEDDYAIGEAIIGNIDEDGYLTADIEEIAETLECDVAEVERVHQVILTFEPTGVGARNLKECLLIQLLQLGLENTVAYDIVEKDLLEDLEANRFPQIARKLGVELELVRVAADAISSLEPKPGRQFGLEKPEYVVPDVTVEEIDGEYKVFMNDEGPSLRLSPYYRSLVRSRGSLTDETREYIRSKLKSASWLLESIQRRRSTILMVTESIFEVQRDFLEMGRGHLKPLTLREIADMVGVHEATVSRVTRNRYVQTPRGVFELKYFFNSGISTEGGGVVSSANVKGMIQNMVDNEDPQNPLSDKEIESMLRERRIKIARRTIAKYRAELGILPSSKRKKW
jgi:RNA polymerase sigma-54 factor